MRLLPLKPKSSSLTFWMSLFTDIIWSQSFLCENLTMILSLLFVRRWHDSILRDGISQPNLLNTSSTLDSRSSLETSRGMPTISKHSLLQYWAYPQHYLSISTTLLLKSALTFLAILISDSRLTKFLLNLRISSRASVFALLYALTLLWSGEVIQIFSLFDNLSNVPSVWLMGCCDCRQFI